jgi:hypothetical protein
MLPKTLSAIFPNRTHVSTEEAADLLLVQPQTMRKQFSIRGEYAGIRPSRLPSRKLAWPLDAILTYAGCAQLFWAISSAAQRDGQYKVDSGDPHSSYEMRSSVSSSILVRCATKRAPLFLMPVAHNRATSFRLPWFPVP